MCDTAATHCQSRVVGRAKLAAARPEDFDGVVLRRVVAGADHDAAMTLRLANDERQLGRAAKAVEKKNREAGGGHHLAAQFGEMPRAVPRVVGDAQRSGLAVVIDVTQDEIGESLRALADRAIVDRGRADRIHRPATPGGAEREDGPKGVLERGPIAAGQYGRPIRGKNGS